jgi:signal transduction histidine kinase
VAQTITSARRWPARAEVGSRERPATSHGGLRSRRFYLVAAATFAIATYLAVELARVASLALFVAANPGQSDQSAASAWIAHASSLIAWLGACLVAGLVAHRFQTGLGSTLTAAHRRGERLALVSEVSGALSGPHPPAEIATKFLQRITDIVTDETTGAVFLYDDATERFTAIAAHGPAERSLAKASFPQTAMPDPIRAPLMKGTPFAAFDLLVDFATVGGRDAWTAFCSQVPGLDMARSCVLVPLCSRNRMVGMLLLRDDRARGVDVEPLQLLNVLAHFLAGALHNAVSMFEAEARAERAALISRVAQHAHASLNDDIVLAKMLEEVAGAVGASTALVQLGTSIDDLRVAYEWHAKSTASIAVGARPQLAVAALAVRDGRTVSVADLRDDPRLDDPALGRRDEHLRVGGVSALATPISLGGQLVGVLLLQATGNRRTWSGDDVRLIEGVARELRVALETVRLFEARTRESDRLLALHRASTELATHTDSDTVIASILRNAVVLLGGGSGSFFRWDAQAGVLRRVHSWQTPDVDGESELRPGEGLAGMAFSQAKPSIVNDYQAWNPTTRPGRERGLRAGLGVPLRPSGKPLGVLLISSYDDTTQFSDDDARLLDLFGDQAAAALMTAEAFEEQVKAVAELERMNKLKSEFVAIVSHEFRTPLTGIQGFSEMLRDEDLTIAEMKEYAVDINKDARRLNRLVGEMLDLSRMESGRMALHLESVDLNAIVSDAVASTQANAPKHRLIVHLDEALPILAADRDKITQVVTNLASNAVKYAPEGGEITFTTRAEGNIVHLTVSDRGMGMPKDMLERIFEPYSRVESGANRFIRGTGLGLPIARQLLNLHGGRIWAESVEGEGSTFHCLIPVGAKPRAN